MGTAQSEDEVEHYVKDADEMATIAWCKIKGLFLRKADLVHPRCTQEKDQSHVEEILFGILKT